MLFEIQNTVLAVLYGTGNSLNDLPVLLAKTVICDREDLEGMDGYVMKYSPTREYSQEIFIQVTKI